MSFGWYAITCSLINAALWWIFWRKNNDKKDHLECIIGMVVGSFLFTPILCVWGFVDFFKMIFKIKDREKPFDGSALENLMP